MGRYLEKKSGIIWVILTLLLFIHIFGPIIGELVTAFIVVIAIGVIIWFAPLIVKRDTSKQAVQP